jgi:hypothetical protein
MISELINKIILPNKGFLYLIFSIIITFSYIFDLYREGVKPTKREVE